MKYIKKKHQKLQSSIFKYQTCKIYMFINIFLLNILYIIKILKEGQNKQKTKLHNTYIIKSKSQFKKNHKYKKKKKIMTTY